MGEKLSPYATYGTKLISAYSRLLFSQHSHSLSGLASMLGCSKQTVLRLINDIRLSYGVEIEETVREKKKYYRLKKKAACPALPLTATELTVLGMCKAFTEHLLGPELMKEAAQAIDKSTSQLKAGCPATGFSAVPAGAIDYTPHQDTIRVLIKAMGESLICKVTYKAAYDGRAKTFFIKPLRLFSHKDCLYLSARMAHYPGRKHKEPHYDPLLVVHRIVKTELTDRLFERPNDPDELRDGFGVMADEPFTVTADFRDWAATYVSERIWSYDQKITRRKDGSVRLKFTAASELEAISWLLSFREDCVLVKPKRLVDSLTAVMRGMLGNYVSTCSDRPMVEPELIAHAATQAAES